MTNEELDDLEDGEKEWSDSLRGFVIAKEKYLPLIAAAREANRLRDEVLRLRDWAIEAEAQQRGRIGAEKRVAELETDVSGLNNMLRLTGYGQGQIDSYVACEEECERLKERIAELEIDNKIDLANYHGKCGACATACKDMLTDSYCAECRVAELEAGQKDFRIRVQLALDSMRLCASPAGCMEILHDLLVRNKETP